LSLLLSKELSILYYRFK